ncbi:glutamate-5-semialdehyde dehydrogenase [Flavihumibacter fluvii]|uniref:glutamate-5-semialdehyde dehydrogenase n=1 Tax=Flavihumibacter fluvii TaxID=2838157 RepID=UPI001BDEE625|nr:glutamate-5-semialdehyde dehydrogenase [Flavihumibacter fluvii]ULQ53425.1 glutamate-5-semialdehyde dehydrogenase [Flavihumibacter fluvii]
MKTVASQIQRTHAASAGLQAVPNIKVQQVLRALADALMENTHILLKANAKDLAKQPADNPKNDRLLLNAQRIANIAASIKKVAKLPDPTGQILEKRTLDNGLLLQKISVPLGVVGAIYESRPNVTFDIAALSLRSRNACVLKGSADASHTNSVAVSIIKKVLSSEGLNPDLICLLPANREVVDDMMTATKFIDVLIPRGSDGLIKYVRNHSQVPVIETGAGVCHIYVEAEADLKKALAIVVNAKVSRPSVCNAVDAILVDKAVAPAFLSTLKKEFEKDGVEIFADKIAHGLLKGYPFLHIAKEEDFGREFLSLKCAIKVVDDLSAALHHIALYSTKHSESIISENQKTCEAFIRQVDAAVVYSNASTRFTDGEVFGLGAEIGISTQKLHARGPFALEKLVTEKWILRGKGQVR